jgi:peptidoglycan/LPS O-acetylase OafA/YrhL
MKIAYRPDIDGLRAVAVIAILHFHFDERWLPGGFVGADIFFVISGLLITSLIIGERSAAISHLPF